ncbi:inner nuclear membrane protein Man1 [Drosophila grimshawi]|uniref:GH21715 n=1 Tax=Drosophila grimshawi TaxID=7222 RepID=B4J6E1_DROGR|nr:inner nuclear membrane protein Man1 [Drosophila grimshawi]EDW01942.1 GH21715 [Drosophila grimshawi]
MPSEYWDRLSDVEIQGKLIQFGYPHCPVTETTRAVLIKKLQKHTRKEELKKGKIPNYVLHYNGDKPNTDAIPAPHTNSIERRPNLHENGLRNNKVDIGRTLQPSVYRKSDADVSPSLMAASRMYVPPPLLASDYENENDAHNLNAARKAYRKPLPYAADNSSSYIKLQHGKSNACDGGVVNRLLSFRDTSIQKKSISKDGYTVHASRSLIIKNGIVQKILTFDVKSFFKKPDVSQYIIPHVLIAILVIFLSMISVLYMAKKFDLSPITETDIKYTMCNGNDADFRGFSSSSQSQPTIKCINEDLYNKAIYISKELFKYLNERARLHHCISADHSAALDMNEFKKVLLSGNSNLQQNGNLHTKLLATQYLIAQNPQWMIKTITTTHNSSEQILSFELIEPSLPLKCIIRKKVTRFFTVIGLFLLVAAGCLSLYLLIVGYRLKQKESLLAIEQFTMDIINELVYRSTHTENSEVLINQLQEKFLPAHNRKKLSGCWNKALKNLEANDNILFGIVARNGEQLRTMTWNKNTANNEPSSTTTATTTKKKWQSSAFDNSNKIHNPPASCLKIRHMFDPSEINDPNLRQLMIDSILEKVGSHCKICDVQLDTQSCCVYIRCASEADAGIVHNEINGWWFDKRLISIKFLRIERYLNRFPKSLSESLYLKSSNVN